MTQKNISDRNRLLVLALLSSFPPLSTDLYLPALPQMVVSLATTQARLNLTLSLFFICFAVSILFWGPLSEKYGRKPVLFAGLGIYCLASLICALAKDIDHLIICRALQAVGGGASTAVSTAIVKDIYSGRRRETVLAVVMSLVIAAPVVAPMAGALLLKFVSWRAIFWVMAGMGVLAALATFLLEESLPQKYSGSTLKSLSRLLVVMKNPGFSSLLFIFSMVAMPMMGFISASAYVYIQKFGLSEQTFSLLFSFNALCAMAGPFIYVRFSKKIPAQNMIFISFCAMALFGMIMVFAGQRHYLIFALTMGPATLSITSMRPPSTNLMLEQQEFDSGSASALINCMGMVMGSLGIFLLSEEAGSQIPVLGMLLVSTGTLGGVLWVVIRNRPFIRQVHHDGSC